MLFFYVFLLFGNLHVASSFITEPMCLDVSPHYMGKHMPYIWTPCPNQTLRQRSYLRSPDQKSAPFDITFQCLHTEADICGKAERAFTKAGEIISKVILFKEPVRVNATMMSFCQVENECGKNMMTLGGSSPARAIPFLNNDGLTRLHAQALVKQFGLSDHPAYAPFDILSMFNADAPFWFEEDNVPITSKQADFLFVILHEFMHGLGFYSGWNEYISPQLLTPDPSPFLANQVMLMINPSTTAIHQSHFFESAMDRLLTVIKPNDKSTFTPISEFTKQLNKIEANTIEELVNHKEFAPAKVMTRFSTQSGTLGIKLQSEKEPVILETSLHPFQPGSSISHVSYDEYTNTPDFLMRFMQDRGLTLQQAIRKGGWTGPIGPLLLGVFEELGYATIENPDNIPPLLIFQQQNSGKFAVVSSAVHTQINMYLLFISCSMFLLFF